MIMVAQLTLNLNVSQARLTDAFFLDKIKSFSLIHNLFKRHQIRKKKVLFVFFLLVLLSTVPVQSTNMKTLPYIAVE
jgi:hypothetical protein